MATDSDKEYLTARELDNKICVNIVTMVALVFTAAFVLVTTFAFLNIIDLEEKDAALRQDIENLHRKLQTYKESRGDVVKDADTFLAEVEKVIMGGVVDEMDIDEKESNVKEDKSARGEPEKERRQSIDIFGAILAAQRSVFEKYCVSHNTSCPKGPRGNNGTTGDPGLKGVDGVPGTSSIKGVAGETGSPGQRGDVGPKGLYGDQGINGTKGLIGDTGAWGNPVYTGEKGELGPRGDKGVDGVKGPIGNTGQPGVNGTRGIKGPMGNTGDPGLKGLNGTRGDPGIQGQGVSSLGPDCECYKKPTFRNPRDESITVGPSMRMTIPCTGEGNPPPNITVTQLPQKHTGKRTLEHTGNQYSISRPEAAEYGRYVCTATNKYGSATKFVTVQKPTSG